MHAIVFLIIIGVIVAGGFLIAFIWAVKSGQYDDNYSPAVRILFDDDIPKKKKEEEENSKDTKQNNDNKPVNSL
ncbi:MAG: cbb3-type cytochrome oxidase assembly protein CcoS [Bacteroidales bacterium]|nr:cbb3-type cytochrome oxidase assembly protein CcoS [Bacteroidales bacterium]